MDHAMTSGRYTRVTQYPLYHPRQLVTPTELNLETSYFLDRLRRHNRLLHGWGVICGALVCRVVGTDGTAQPWKVKITPGHLIDPYGNEIAILAERVIDLRSSGGSFSCDDPAGELSDPWCSEVWTEPTTGRLWVAVKYFQGKARLVRAQPTGCSCDDTSCEYSRWCDGYQVGLLHGCPPSHVGDPPALDHFDGEGHIPACPPEPTDPWVNLAVVDLDGDGRITAIDNCSCRRMIVALAHLWWRCESTQLAVTKVTTEVDSTAVKEVPRGTTGVAVHIDGTNIDPNAGADLGQGIQVTDTEVPDGTTMNLTVSVLDSAQPGSRELTVTNSDCAIATFPDALTVSSPTTRSAGPKRRRPRRPS